MISENSKAISKHKTITKSILKTENQRKMVWLLQNIDQQEATEVELQNLFWKYFQQECSAGSIKYTLNTLRKVKQVKYICSQQKWILDVFHPELDIYFERVQNAQEEPRCERCNQPLCSDDETAAIQGLIFFIAKMREQGSSSFEEDYERSHNQNEDSKHEKDLTAQDIKRKRKQLKRFSQSQESTESTWDIAPQPFICLSQNSNLDSTSHPGPVFDQSKHLEQNNFNSSQTLSEENLSSDENQERMIVSESSEQREEIEDDSENDSEDDSEDESMNSSDESYEISEQTLAQVDKRLEEIRQLQSQGYFVTQNKPVLRNSQRYQNKQSKL